MLAQSTSPIRGAACGRILSKQPIGPKLRRSDTPVQHQSDPRHRSNLIPTPGQNDDTNRVELAARTAWVDVIAPSELGKGG